MSDLVVAMVVVVVVLVVAATVVVVTGIAVVGRDISVAASKSRIKFRARR